jgi:two-component system, NtrC family, response regulator AtoC
MGSVARSLFWTYLSNARFDMAKILLVDDEERLRRIVTALLAERGHEVTQAATGEAGIEKIRQSAFDVVLLDYQLQGIDGLEACRLMRDHDPSPAFIFLTAYGTVRSAVDAMRAGAFDYLSKPFDNDELLLIVDRALELRRLAKEVESLRTELESRYGFDEMVGISPAMREVFRVISRAAPTTETVLILGESGTGKELVARAIHRKSLRSTAMFLPVNCTATPATLFESEYFGYERGAFTDAKVSTAGKFETAHRGTIFLDEIGDLPLEIQGKLLRVIEDKQVTRLGSHRQVAADVRVIAATNRDLERAVKNGTFREDLYWRLNVVTVRLPALRERGADLTLLIDLLLARLGAELGVPQTSVSNEARRAMLAYEWPGNVRELQNALRAALITSEGGALLLADLPPRIRGNVSAAVAGGTEPASLAEAVRRATERIERAYIQMALTETGGSRAAAAQRLGINRKTLFNKMQLYGMTTEADIDVD